MNHAKQQSDSLPDRPLVMVVEDDLLIAETLQIALDAKNYDVLGPTATLAGAYALLDHAFPDVALVDYQLAASTTEQLVSSLNARHIPICLLTGVDPVKLPPAYDGCRILRKPFRLNALLDALRLARAA